MIRSGVTLLGQKPSIQATTYAQTLRQPVLLIWGFYDPVFPQEDGTRLDLVLKARGVNAASEYRVAPVSGHIPHIEEKDKVNEWILDFLRTNSDYAP